VSDHKDPSRPPQALVEVFKAQRRLQRSPRWQEQQAANAKLAERIARERPDLCRRLRPNLTSEQLEKRKALLMPPPGLAEVYRLASEQADLELALEAVEAATTEPVAPEKTVEAVTEAPADAQSLVVRTSVTRPPSRKAKRKGGRPKVPETVIQALQVEYRRALKTFPHLDNQTAAIAHLQEWFRDSSKIEDHDCPSPSSLIRHVIGPVLARRTD
jgi:hypothetical protein